MGKLWNKGYELNKLVEKFTVGDDFLIDKHLISSDILGSLAHADTLKEANLLNENQFLSIRRGLLQILEEHESGNFVIQRSDEDGHTAIENRLTVLCGEAGKHIHLGRSRNDQILTAMRIWMREFLFNLVDAGGDLISALLDFAETHKNVPMPGRTHMQPAMPSSVGLWAGGFAEQLLDDVTGAASLYSHFDQCPLGSGAGYGTPLPLNREHSARLLGFSRVQSNVAYCGLSRGKFEARLLEALDHIAISLSKFSWDLILFSLPEFGWFTLPEQLCTGSSIMPQKRNPDALELMRARSASVGAWASQVKNIIRQLPSGYNRDFQDTKAPTLKAADVVLSMMDVSALCVKHLKVNPKRLESSFADGIFAADAALKLTASGMSFRDAYKEVALNPEKYKDSENSPHKAIENRTSTGTSGNLKLETAGSALASILKENRTRREKTEAALNALKEKP